MSSIGDLTPENEIAIVDKDTGLAAQVETSGGKARLLTETSVTTVNVSQGQDPIPDTFFTILTAGAIGDTVRVQVAATSSDSTSPDSDLVAVDVTYTLIAEDVGDEHKLAKNISEKLNDDTNFQDAFLDSGVPSGDRRAIVHITSTEFSLDGEFFERPNTGDVSVSVTGTTTISIDTSNEVLISRAKASSLARDPDNPHRLGVLAISGSVQVTPGAITNRFELELLESGGDGNMANFNGSSTPVSFSLAQSATDDLFVTRIIIHALDNGIKLRNFLGLNSELTNGIDLDVKADDGLFSFPVIKSTREIKRFSSTGGWYPDFEAGADDAMAIKLLGITPIVIRATGTFVTDDFFTVTINDNLTSVLELKVIAIGFRRPV